MKKAHVSHGTGEFAPADLKGVGEGVIFEKGVLVFHPEMIELGTNIYVGHGAILKGYYQNTITIGDNTWIGQNCFFHGAGGISIGRNVGIGPAVQIITSYHREQGIEIPILFSELAFAKVTIADDADIGVGAIILPGVSIGKGVQIGAGAVVTRSVPDFAVAYGNPARVKKTRK